eukprot:Colp12_sorted_trinity150504_noHs@8292
MLVSYRAYLSGAPHIRINAICASNLVRLGSQSLENRRALHTQKEAPHVVNHSHGPHSHHSHGTHSHGHGHHHHHHHKDHKDHKTRPHKHGKFGDFIYHPAPNHEQEKNRPLAVLIGWMLSSPKHIQKYCELYHAKGVDTLFCNPGPKHVLFPSVAKGLAKNALDTLCLPDFKERSLIFHGFSVGGYLYATVVETMATQAKEYGHVSARVKGQVLDSPVDYHEVAPGMAKVLSNGNPVGQKVLHGIFASYLKATYPLTGKKHVYISNFFGESPLDRPSLWLYSNEDHIAPAHACENMMERWRKKGLTVSGRKFVKSPHVMHYPTNPPVYQQHLHEFLDNVLENETTQETVGAVATAN